MMDFYKTYITRHLPAITLLLICSLYIACFDIPTQPSKNNTLKSVSVQIEQNNVIDSVLLKIHPSDSAVLSAKVLPRKFKDKLSYTWFYVSNDDSKEVLGNKSSITIPANPSKSKIPNLLQVSDDEGNSILSELTIIVNTPPRLMKETSPAQGDTLYGNTSTSFLFSWNSHDNDNESITHTIKIDTTLYEVGKLTQLYQSGFSEGRHTFQVFVFDQYGDMDSTSTISFYVTNKVKGEK